MAEKTEKLVAPIPVVSLERPDLLMSPKRRGFHRRWIRNTEEDIERMTEIGYQVAKREGADTPVTRRELILMEVPEAIYAERVRLKVAKVRERRARAAKTASQETERLAQSEAFKGLAKAIGGVTTTGGEGEPL